MQEADSKPTRLDQYVVSQIPAISRAHASRLIENGQVTVNKQPEHKAGYRVRAGDAIEIDFNAVEAAKTEKISLPVIYEDKDCVVINKPVGVLSHSKGSFNPEGTVATWLSSRVKGLSGERGGIVHRLDRATSGVMICAKTPEALSWLQKQFSLRKAKKSYLAVIRGELANPEAVIDMPIERNPRHPQTFRVGPRGKAAVTAYKVLKTANGLSLVELRPTTGRTHQLRVHLAHLGHPIVGDVLYGGARAERLLLHALSLEITLPNKRRQTFEAPAPPIFEEQLS